MIIYKFHKIWSQILFNLCIKAEPLDFGPFHFLDMKPFFFDYSNQNPDPFSIDNNQGYIIFLQIFTPVLILVTLNSGTMDVVRVDLSYGGVTDDLTKKLEENPLEP